MDKIILIGGAPTTGKSHTARILSKQLGIPWISTDTIREQMREIVDKEKYPHLFRYSNATVQMALETFKRKKPSEIVETQNDESIEVWRGIKAIIDTDYVWKSFIIEGIAIIPKLINKLKIEDKKITTIFLVDKNIERIRETIYTRGLWDDANKYPDSIKEKEVEWVTKFNEYIFEEAKKYNFEIIEIINREDHIKDIIKKINN